MLVWNIICALKCRFDDIFEMLEFKFWLKFTCVLEALQICDIVQILDKNMSKCDKLKV